MWRRLIPKSDRKKIHEYLFRGKLLSLPLPLPNCGSWLKWGNIWNELDGMEMAREVGGGGVVGSRDT